MKISPRRWLDIIVVWLWWGTIIVLIIWSLLTRMQPSNLTTVLCFSVPPSGLIILVICFILSEIESDRYEELWSLVSHKGISKEPFLLMEEYLAKQGFIRFYQSERIELMVDREKKELKREKEEQKVDKLVQKFAEDI